MAKPIELKVHFAKDEETGRWYIAQSDIPGLRLEADSADELIRKVEEVAPDLIELNGEEIMANVRQTAKRGSDTQARARRLPVSIRPVFDSPMAVAC